MKHSTSALCVLLVLTGPALRPLCAFEGSLYYNRGGELSQPNATQDWSGPFDTAQMALDEKRYDYALAVTASALSRRPPDPVVAGLHRLRGDAYLGKGDKAQARAEYTLGISFVPKSAWDYVMRAAGYLRLRNYKAAANDYRKALEMKPEDSDVLNAVAWFKATCPEGSWRDGREAVRLATKACELTRWRDGDVLDTLAAAEAEAGDFDAAGKHEEDAIKRTVREFKKEKQERLALYRGRTPYREHSKYGEL